MSTSTAVVVGALLGFSFMLTAAVWITLTGTMSPRVGIGALVAFLSLQLVLAVASGSLESAILLTLGSGVGIAFSSIVTLPLTALLYRHFAHKREAA